MPFIVPLRHMKVSNRTTFSRYKNVDDSPYFLLQKRKAAFRNDRSPVYRIITQQHPSYEVANGDDLAELQANEWDYIVTHLPRILPVYLPAKDRHHWLVAHFTQLGLEASAEAQLGSDADEELEEEEEEEEGLLSGERSGTGRHSLLLRNNPSDTDQSDARPVPRSPGSSSGIGLEHLEQARQRVPPRRRFGVSSSASSDSLGDNSGEPGGSDYGSAAAQAQAAEPLRCQPIFSIVRGRQLQIVFRGLRAAMFCIGLTLGLAWGLRNSSDAVFGGALGLVAVLLLLVIGRGDPAIFALLLEPRSAQVLQGKATSSNTVSPTSGSSKSDLAWQRRVNSVTHPPELLASPPGSPVASQRMALAGFTTDDSATEEEGEGEAEDEHYEEHDEGEEDNEPLPEAARNTSYDPNKGMPLTTLGMVAPDALVPEMTSCWTLLQGQTFMCRVGPNYKKLGKKGPSRPSMYSCAGVDAFVCPEKQFHIMERLNLPTKPCFRVPGTEASTVPASPGGHPDKLPGRSRPRPDGLPQWLVVNILLPNYAPAFSFSRKEEQGPGWSLVCYFKMNSATESHLDTQPEPGDPSVALLKRFLQARPDDDSDYCKRFKCIPRAVNVGELNLGRALKGLLTTYNSKPFMTGPKCHRLFYGPNYVELDVDYHSFVFLAKKGMHQFSEMLGSFVFDLGFVIQAEADEEMPERVLGCVRISKVELEKLPTIDQALQAREPLPAGAASQASTAQAAVAPAQEASAASAAVVAEPVVAPAVVPADESASAAVIPATPLAIHKS